MKKILFAYLLFAALIVWVTSVNAESFSIEKRGKIIENISAGLSSDNQGLRVSSALVLGNLIDLKYLNSEESGKTVVTLMKMLHNGNTDEEKISAALALYKVGAAKGIYGLKQMSKLDESSRVKNICYKLYCSYHKQNGTEYLMEN
jgi:hypothetical protein